MRCFLAIAALLLVVGCEGEPRREPDPPTPTLGGATPTAAPPTGVMDDLERPIAARLAVRVAAQGLHVDHLECPDWDRKVPATLSCTGWFDRVQGNVVVSLTRGSKGAVTYDAVLEDGVIATKNLVSELVAKGYDDVDCGALPAYPTEIGGTITCSVVDGGTQKYVLATIANQAGAVTLTDL